MMKCNCRLIENTQLRLKIEFMQALISRQFNDNCVLSQTNNDSSWTACCNNRLFYCQFLCMRWLYLFLSLFPHFEVIWYERSLTSIFICVLRSYPKHLWVCVCQRIKLYFDFRLCKKRKCPYWAHVFMNSSKLDKLNRKWKYFFALFSSVAFRQASW